MEDQTCALRERLVADSAVWVDESALKMRLAGASFRGRDQDFLVGVAGQDLEAGVVLPARDRRLLGCHCLGLSAPVATSLVGLIHSAKRCARGRCHSLDRWRVDIA